MTNQDDWGRLLRDWALWMAGCGMSPRTIEHRVEVITLFARRQRIDPLRAEWRDVARFLTEGPVLQPGTKQNYHATLRAWFQWLLSIEHRIEADPTARVRVTKVPTRRPRPIATTDLQRVLSSGLYRRTRTMILLGALHGMRAMEIAAMDGAHIEAGWHTIIGKGGVERRVPVHPAIAAEAAGYPRGGFWFPSPYRAGEPVKPSSVSNVIGKAMRRAGVAASAHTLRHWYGTWTLDGEGNVNITQELLGHAHLSTTSIYTQGQDAGKLRAVYGLPLPTYVARSRSYPRSLLTA